jgi:hypothetical protein
MSLDVAHDMMHNKLKFCTNTWDRLGLNTTIYQILIQIEIHLLSDMNTK